MSKKPLISTATLLISKTASGAKTSSFLKFFSLSKGLLINESKRALGEYFRKEQCIGELDMHLEEILVLLLKLKKEFTF